MQNQSLLFKPQSGITTSLIFLLFIHFALALIPATCLGDEPLEELTPARIEVLKTTGDRLADQGDYQGALENYTRAYLGVVSRIRGQKFSRSVPPNILNRKQLAADLEELVKKEFTAEELALMDSAFKAFGLVPRSMDTIQLMKDLLTEEVAGFYDPDTKRMVLIVEESSKEEPGWLGRLLGAKPTFDKDEQKITLAHELTHALQDQLYDLNAMEDGIDQDDDMMLAFSALVEGDATLLMFCEAGDQDVREMDPAAMRAGFAVMSWLIPIAGGETLRKAPPIFRESLTFPYLQGMLFGIALAAEGGWPEVHAAYANPPLSTEQILHPEKYLDQLSLDTPQRVIIPELTHLLASNGADASEPSSWNHLGGNCLGEMQLAIMLKRVLGGSKAAVGWDGDRYEIYQHADGNLGLVSVSVWDSQEDAEEFVSAYQKYREQNSGGINGQDESQEQSDHRKNSGDNTGVFDSTSRRVIQRHADRVWIVEGFSESQTQAIVDNLNDCSYELKDFPLPSSTIAP